MQIAFGAPLASPSSSAALSVNFPPDIYYLLAIASIAVDGAPLASPSSSAALSVNFPPDIFYPLAIACNRRGDVV